MVNNEYAVAYRFKYSQVLVLFQEEELQFTKTGKWELREL
jgi:hypothetical protein